MPSELGQGIGLVEYCVHLFDGIVSAESPDRPESLPGEGHLGPFRLVVIDATGVAEAGEDRIEIIDGHELVGPAA